MAATILRLARKELNRGSIASATASGVLALFIGLRSDEEARALMGHLARVGRGRYHEYDLSTETSKLLGTMIGKISATRFFADKHPASH